MPSTDSAADTSRVGPFAHISVWCILSLDKYGPDSASEGTRLEFEF